MAIAGKTTEHKQHRFYLLPVFISAMHMMMPLNKKKKQLTNTLVYWF